MEGTERKERTAEIIEGKGEAGGNERGKNKEGKFKEERRGEKAVITACSATAGAQRGTNGLD